MFEFDPHLHSIASGHATSDTITDIAKKGARTGLNMIGITDHGPATLGSCKASYFRNLVFAPRKRCGIDILYGVELNILDYNGTVDLEDNLLEHLDYAIISMHMQNIKPGSIAENTSAYINAMKHPNVRIVGHCDDTQFPVDYESLIIAAKHQNVVLEINNSSLSPEGYRGDVRENVRTILKLCKKHAHPVVLSSDSHGAKHVGDFHYAMELIKEVRLPEELVLNYSSMAFKDFIK